MTGTITWRELWGETAQTIDEWHGAQRLGVVESRRIARFLCEAASGAEGTEFLEILEDPATERTVHQLDAMVARLGAGEPLQYVLGRWGFRHLDLMVDRRVLIPRPETEQVVDVALAIARDLRRELRALGAHRSLTIADLGTGSGAIGLSLAQELPIGAADVWLTDASADALDVARANAAGLGRNAACIRTATGSWCAALPAELLGTFDLIVSNPPYVADDDPGLEDVVREWEPHGALFGGGDGLDQTRAIAEQAIAWLAPGGALVLEISDRNGAAVAELLTSLGYVAVRVDADLAGRDRIAQAKRAAT
jgi:release factor glutamine methyltransferase